MRLKKLHHNRRKKLGLLNRKQRIQRRTFIARNAIKDFANKLIKGAGTDVHRWNIQEHLSQHHPERL